MSLIFAFVTILMVIAALRVGWLFGLQRRHELYASALAEIKRNYEAEIEACEKVNRQFEYVYYFAGILVGMLAVWLWLKYRE